MNVVEVPLHVTFLFNLLSTNLALIALIEYLDLSHHEGICIDEVAEDIVI